MEGVAVNHTSRVDESSDGRAEASHFYAIGVGPGAPDLLTIRAARLIESADTIIAPRSRTADASLALRTVRQLISEDQEVVEHVYAMRRDIDETMRSWQGVADLICERCREGEAVVQLTIGDPALYSTSCYLLSLLLPRLPHERIHVVPGISAFQSAAGIFCDALTVQEDRMMLMPATNLERVAEALDHCETLVLYKAGRMIDRLADLLESRGLLGRTRLVCYAEHERRQFVTDNLREAANGEHGYMATVIIQIARRPWASPSAEPVGKG
jgi:precorrin-2/cobalt-factor-2 C20-methyltransferase